MRRHATMKHEGRRRHPHEKNSYAERFTSDSADLLCYNLAAFFLVSCSFFKGCVGLSPTAVDLPFTCAVGGGHAEEPVKQLRTAACGVNSRTLARLRPRRGPAHGVCARLVCAGRSSGRNAGLQRERSTRSLLPGLVTLYRLQCGCLY